MRIIDIATLARKPYVGYKYCLYGTGTSANIVVQCGVLGGLMSGRAVSLQQSRRTISLSPELASASTTSSSAASSPKSEASTTELMIPALVPPLRTTTGTTSSTPDDVDGAAESESRTSSMHPKQDDSNNTNMLSSNAGTSSATATSATPTPEERTKTVPATDMDTTPASTPPSADEDGDKSSSKDAQILRSGASKQQGNATLEALSSSLPLHIYTSPSSPKHGRQASTTDEMDTATPTTTSRGRLPRHQEIEDDGDAAMTADGSHDQDIDNDDVLKPDAIRSSPNEQQQHNDDEDDECSYSDPLLVHRVFCRQCQASYQLPFPVDRHELPRRWVCTMNTWCPRNEECPTVKRISPKNKKKRDRTAATSTSSSDEDDDAATPKRHTRRPKKVICIDEHDDDEESSNKSKNYGAARASVKRPHKAPTTASSMHTGTGLVTEIKKIVSEIEKSGNDDAKETADRNSATQKDQTPRTTFNSSIARGQAKKQGAKVSKYSEPSSESDPPESESEPGEDFDDHDDDDNSEVDSEVDSDDDFSKPRRASRPNSRGPSNPSRRWKTQLEVARRPKRSATNRDSLPRLARADGEGSDGEILFEEEKVVRKNKKSVKRRATSAKHVPSKRFVETSGSAPTRQVSRRAQQVKRRMEPTLASALLVLEGKTPEIRSRRNDDEGTPEPEESTMWDPPDLLTPIEIVQLAPFIECRKCRKRRRLPQQFFPYTAEASERWICGQFESLACEVPQGSWNDLVYHLMTTPSLSQSAKDATRGLTVYSADTGEPTHIITDMDEVNAIVSEILDAWKPPAARSKSKKIVKNGTPQRGPSAPVPTTVTSMPEIKVEPTVSARSTRRSRRSGGDQELIALTYSYGDKDWDPVSRCWIPKQRPKKGPVAGDQPAGSKTQVSNGEEFVALPSSYPGQMDWDSAAACWVPKKKKKKTSPGKKEHDAQQETSHSTMGETAMQPSQVKAANSSSNASSKIWRNGEAIDDKASEGSGVARCGVIHDRPSSLVQGSSQEPALLAESAQETIAEKKQDIVATAEAVRVSFPAKKPTKPVLKKTTTDPSTAPKKKAVATSNKRKLDAEKKSPVGNAGSPNKAKGQNAKKQTKSRTNNPKILRRTPVLKKTTKDPPAASKKKAVATSSKRKLDAETKSPVAKAGVSIKAKRHYATPPGTVFLDLTKPAATPTTFAISKGRENLGGKHPMNALFQAVEKARDMPVNDGVNDTLNVYNNDDDDDMNAPDEFEDRYASNVFVDAYLPNVFQHSASDEGSSSSIYEDAEEELSDIPKSDKRQSTPKVTGRPIVELGSVSRPVVELGSRLALASASCNNSRRRRPDANEVELGSRLALASASCNNARRRRPDANKVPSKKSSIYEASDDDSVVFVKTKTPSKNKAPKTKDPATTSQKPLDQFEARYAANVFVDPYLPNVFQHSASDEGSSSSIYENAEERLSDMPKSDKGQSTPKVTGRPIVKLGSGLAMKSATTCNNGRRRDAKEAPSKRSSIYEASDDDSVVFVKTKTPSKNKAPKTKDPATTSQKPLDQFEARYASNVFVDPYLPNVFQHSASDEGSSSSIYEDAEERLSDMPKSDKGQSTPKVTGRPIVKLGSGLAMKSATTCNNGRRRDAKEAPSKRSSIYEASDDDSVVFVKTKTPKNKAPKKKDPATISQKPLDYLRSTLGFPGAAAPQPSLATGHWQQMYGVENPFGIEQDFNRNQATLPLANAGGLKNPGLLLANAGLVNVGDLRNSGLPSANAAGSRNPELRLPLYGPLAHVSSVEQGRIASQSQTATDIHLAAQNPLAAQMQQMATTQNQLGAQNQFFLATAQMQQAASSTQQDLFPGQAPVQNTDLTATAQGANRLLSRPSFPPGVFASHAGSPADFRGHS